jgi:uncharacterized protein (TIRG00374 family)
LTNRDENPQIEIAGVRDQGFGKSFWQGSLGILVGLIALWLVSQFVDLGETKAAILATRSSWLVGAVLIYWLGICVRIVRWRYLLVSLADISSPQVADALIVGYAMNCLLPARLGEPFRAEYTQRRFGIDRVAVFGSIVTERVLDGLLLVLILVFGLALASNAQISGDLTHFHLVAYVGFLLFAFAAAVLVAVRKIPFVHLSGRPKRLTQLLSRFMKGAAGLSRRNLGNAASLTVFVWMLELTAIWVLLAGLGTAVTFYQMLVLVGAGALSTLVPTAPGYVGSLQLVFAAVMTVFALPPAVGVAAATLVQAVFYGSLIIAAALIVVLRWLRRLRS